MITTAQIRAARGLLRWTVKDLAEKSGVSSPTIHRLEQEDGIPSGRSQTLAELQKALERANVEFIGTPDNDPGVRLRTQR